MSAAIEQQSATVRFLPLDERWKLATIYAEQNSPLPDENAAVLVLEYEDRIVGHLAFHNITALGMTHIDSEWSTVGASGLKILISTAMDLFKTGDTLFVPIAEGESTAMAQQLGCVPIGQLFRKDFI